MIDELNPIPEIKLTPEEIKAKIQCEEMDKMKEFYPELDFTAELEQKPHLCEFVQKQIQMEAANV